MEAKEFHLPRYRQLPSVGLYLEQTVKYVNDCLSPLGMSITQSMLSNYVKQGYIRRPEQKLYGQEQIAYLIFLALAKQVLSMENIAVLFRMQQEICPVELAYTFFFHELERTLTMVFSGRNDPPAEGEDTQGRQILRSVVIAVSHIIYLSHCFQKQKEESTWSI